MMKRKQRIAEAEAKLAAMAPVLEQLKAVQAELRIAYQSYDIGERVRVEEPSDDDCCVAPNEYDGVVVECVNSDTYIIQTGQQRRWATIYRMHRGEDVDG